MIYAILAALLLGVFLFGYAAGSHACYREHRKALKQ